MFIENVTTIKVDSEAAVLALLAKGSKARSVGETQVHVHVGSAVCLLNFVARNLLERTLAYSPTEKKPR